VKIIGYGEDFLTYYYLKYHLRDFIRRIKKTIKDNSGIKYIFYRPSFGRRQHGEFDAIIISKKKIYLIESKWDNLKKNPSKKIIINKTQRRRHKKFMKFLKNLKEGNGVLKENITFFNKNIQAQKPVNILLYFYKIKKTKGKVRGFHKFQINYEDWLYKDSNYIVKKSF
jgi:hypothetical protein